MRICVGRIKRKIHAVTKCEWHNKTDEHHQAMLYGSATTVTVTPTAISLLTILGPNSIKLLSFSKITREEKTRLFALKQ